jgi:TonB family protein
MTAESLHKPDAAAAPAPRYRPDWLKKPTGEDLAWAYPVRAAREGLGGKAKIHCFVASDGKLTDCSVVNEDPVGEGFGAAALALAPQFQMTRPPNDFKAPAEITIPIVFAMPKPATPDMAAPSISLAEPVARAKSWIAAHDWTPSLPHMSIAGLVLLVVLGNVARRRWSRRADGKDLSGPNSERR